MNEWSYNEVINALRTLVVMVFLCGMGTVFIYSKFTDKPLVIEDIQLILGVLLPYFGLDLASGLIAIKNRQNKD